ncbi:MAG: hypothetical protein KC442_19370, partial [Thermomicrobiales bacterium]|nr:hypothetical protein [Thermomicrobiales bacterium]
HAPPSAAAQPLCQVPAGGPKAANVGALAARRDQRPRELVTTGDSSVELIEMSDRINVTAPDLIVLHDHVQRPCGAPVLEERRR